MPDQPTNLEPVLEAILSTTSKKADETNQLLETVIHQNEKNNPEKALEASLLTQNKILEETKRSNDNTEEVLKAVKDVATISKENIVGVNAEDAEIITLKGETGPEGKQGPVGPEGKEGKEGPEGKQGKEGPVGPKGKDGPVGPEGKQGPIGPMGPNGKNGKNGVDGKDGSPDTAEQIIKKIDGKFSYNSLKDIPEIFRKNSGGAGFLREISDVAINNPTNTQVLSYDSASKTWKNTTQATSSGGSGDVVGPASAVDGNIVTFNGITGKLIKDSGASLSQYLALASSPTIQDSSGQHTWLTIKAPSGDPQEATITTVLDLGSGNKEFVDWTIENYGTDHIASINISKAGTGTLLPFSVRFWNQDLGTIDTHGVKTMTWLPTGEVGLGIALPTEILHIYKATGNFTTIRYDSGTTQGYFFAYDGDNSVNIGSNSNSILNFKVNNLTKASLDTSGNFNAVGTVTGSNLSGTNTGDQTTVSGNAGTATKLATARTIAITGDITYTSPSFDGSGNVTAAGTVTKINGTSLAGLATGILKNTTTTGVPSIAVAGDFPTLNQSTTGSAATLTTPRSIYGNNFDGSAALSQIIASTFGGTGNGFTKFSGPASSEKTFTLPNANATLARTDAAQTFTGSQTFSQVLTTSNAIAASANAATVPITSKINTVTNNSAATLTITLTTTSAIDGQLCQVRVLDFSAAAQTITWINTENGEATAPNTSNGSTTLPRSALFQYNNATSKWRCIAS